MRQRSAKGNGSKETQMTAVSRTVCIPPTAVEKNTIGHAHWDDSLTISVRLLARILVSTRQSMPAVNLATTYSRLFTSILTLGTVDLAFIQ